MFTSYELRPMAYLGVKVVAGYRLKVYTIRYGEQPFDRTRFTGGWDMAMAGLPQPAITEERPGVGFVILHQAKGCDYLVLSWWDCENELPTRVFLRSPEGWRPAAGGESFCVWDLKVIWHEREAYVGTVLSGRADGVDAYLGLSVEGYA